MAKKGMNKGLFPSQIDLCYIIRELGVPQSGQGLDGRVLRNDVQTILCFFPRKGRDKGNQYKRCVPFSTPRSASPPSHTCNVLTEAMCFGGQ